MKFLGTVFIAAGLIPMLLHFDVFGRSSVKADAPDAIAVLACGVFMLGGVAIGFKETRYEEIAGGICAGLIFLAFLLIGNWIAFGPGARGCTVSGIGFFSEQAGIECRIGFGWGAMILNALLLILLGKALSRKLGDGLLSSGLDKAGWGVMVLAFTPILIVFVAAILVRNGGQALKQRLTGQVADRER